MQDFETLNPIDGASVYYSFTNIHQKKESNYKLTGSNGFAQIEVPDLYPQSTILIRCSHISYETGEMEILESIFSKDVIYFRLNLRTKMLDSIVIKSNRLSVLDTIHIEVDTSRLNISNKLIEQLKMDKRFSVNNNSISFKGKLISKVILDNMDLTGNNYMSLLEQLKAESFESIDIIQNFHDNSLDNGFVEPEIAIRINSKKNTKYLSAVNTKVDFTNVYLNQINVNGYFLKENIKTYAAFGQTRLGQTINRPLGVNVTNTGNFWEDSDIAFPHFIFQVANLPTQYTSFNKLSEGLIQTVFHVNRKSTNRILIYHGNMSNNQGIDLLNQIEIDNSTYRFDNLSESKLNSKTLTIENEYKYSAKKDFVKARITVLIPDDNFLHLQKFTGSIEDYMSDNYSLNRSKTANLDLIYSHLINSKLLFEYNLIGEYKDFNEKHTFQSQRAMNLFQTKFPVFDSIYSDINSVNNSISLKTKVKKVSIVGEIGFITEVSKRFLERTVQSPISLNVSNNNSLYKNSSFYLRNFLSLDLKTLPIKIILDNKIAQIRAKILWDTLLGNTNNYLGYNLSVRINYYIGYSMSKIISLDLDYKKVPFDNKLVMPLNFITELFLFNSGIRTKPFTEKISSTLSFRKQKLLDQIPVNFGIIYTYNLRQSLNITERNLLVGYYFLGATFGENINAFGDLTYKFLFSPLKLKINIAAINNYGKFVLNGEYINVSSQYTNIGADLDWRKRNWAFGCLFDWSSSVSKSSDFRSIDKIFKISPRIIFVSNDERFKTEIKYSNFNFINRSSLINVLDVDFNFNFWEKLKFTIYGSNLFNLTNYKIINLSDYIFTQTSYSINPLQIGIKVDVDLY